MGSPNEINANFIDKVEDVVDSQSNDQTEDLELGPTHDGVYLVVWNKVDTNQVIRVVRKFLDKNLS